MKIRNLLFAFVLSALFISGGMSTETPATTRACPYYDGCVNNYYECAADCGSNEICKRNCQNDYIQCQCVNCGLCPFGGGDDPLTDSKVAAKVE